jgi:hypothetical protein
VFSPLILFGNVRIQPATFSQLVPMRFGPSQAFFRMLDCPRLSFRETLARKDRLTLFVPRAHKSH